MLKKPFTTEITEHTEKGMRNQKRQNGVPANDVFDLLSSMPSVCSVVNMAGFGLIP